MKVGKENEKVSLIFYSEENGTQEIINRWNIIIGKKYTIGRSKKKVDISIQDITISRTQLEFIYYDKSKIMVKDCNSSNGTYINKEKIKPYKECYLSINDTISIGDEKNKLIFEFEEEETLEDKSNGNQDKKKLAENLSKNSSPQKYRHKSKDKENDNYKYNDYKYDDDKYYYRQNKYSKKYRGGSKSVSNSNSPKKKDSKYSDKNSKIKKVEKKGKYKNISSYIIKKDSFEEESEKERDKKQVILFNEYLKLKREREKNEDNNLLPVLLPILVCKPKEIEYEEPRKVSSNRNKFGRTRKFIGFKRRGSYQIGYKKYRGNYF